MTEKKKMKRKVAKDVIAQRRARVASLRARGLSLEEIHATLSTEWLAPGKPNPSYLVNPDTGEAWNKATLYRDLDSLNKEAIQMARESIDQHRATQLVEIREARRAAWAARNLPMVHRFMQLEMKLLGTSMPERIEHTGPDGAPITLDLQGLGDDKLARLITGA